MIIQFAANIRKNINFVDCQTNIWKYETHIFNSSDGLDGFELGGPDIGK